MCWTEIHDILGTWKAGIEQVSQTVSDYYYTYTILELLFQVKDIYKKRKAKFKYLDYGYVDFCFMEATFLFEA